jgi:DNA-binding PadR family transcriptional regulator
VSKTAINENDIFTLVHAKRCADDPRTHGRGIYPNSGARSSQFRKLVRHGLLAFDSMGEDAGKPVAIYVLTAQGAEWLQQRAKAARK